MNEFYDHKAPLLAIFIIGESARAGTYGPSQAERGAASKELAERIKRGLGQWLPTTCASSDGTHLSVPLLLTALPPERRDEAPRAPTILGILKASGFSTAWLANNEAGDDAREAGHDLYVSRYHTNPDQFSYETAGVRWKLDEDMLPVAQHFVGKVDRPKAMILHTIGNHASAVLSCGAGVAQQRGTGKSSLRTRRRVRRAHHSTSRGTHGFNFRAGISRIHERSRRKPPQRPQRHRHAPWTTHHRRGWHRSELRTLESGPERRAPTSTGAVEADACQHDCPRRCCQAIPHSGGSPTQSGRTDRQPHYMGTNFGWRGIFARTLLCAAAMTVRRRTRRGNAPRRRAEASPRRLLPARR